MKAAIAPTAFLAAFVASANIRPPPCADCLVPQVNGVIVKVGPGKLADHGDTQQNLRPSPEREAAMRAAKGGATGAAEAIR